MSNVSNHGNILIISAYGEIDRCGDVKITDLRKVYGVASVSKVRFDL